MKAVASLFFTCLLLSFVLVWQAGCNPDAGLQDPLRPRADVQIQSFEPSIVTVGVIRTIIVTQNIDVSSFTVPQPVVTAKVVNGVSALITGYSIVYTFQNNPTVNTGLAVYGGPLSQFIDAAPVQSTLGSAVGEGPAGRTNITVATGNPPGFGSGFTTFQLTVVSPEAQSLLALTQNNLAASITFFLRDVNGHNFTVQTGLTILSIPPSVTFK